MLQMYRGIVMRFISVDKERRGIKLRASEDDWDWIKLDESD